MRVLSLAFVLAATVLILGAWTSAATTVRPACTASDKTLPHLALEDGYTLACGPGFAVVRVKGATYRIHGSKCFRGKTGARLYFGAFDFTNPPQSLSPKDSLYLVVERRQAQPAVADMIDGGMDLITRTNMVLSGIPSGVAHLDAGLKRGTFAGVGRSTGNLKGARFTGSWNCG